MLLGLRMRSYRLWSSENTKKLEFSSNSYVISFSPNYPRAFITVNTPTLSMIQFFIDTHLLNIIHTWNSIS